MSETGLPSVTELREGWSWAMAGEASQAVEHWRETADGWELWDGVSDVAKQPVRDPRGRFCWEPIFQCREYVVTSGIGPDGLVERTVTWLVDKPQPVKRGPPPERPTLSGTALGRVVNNCSARDATDRSPAKARWKLKREARPFQRESVAVCRMKRVARNVVQIQTDGKGAVILGVHTCKSGRDCPICASNLYATRGEEITTACERWRANGGQTLMGSFTVRHQGSNSLAWMVRGISRAFARFKSGRAFRQWWRGELGVVFQIRADDITHGPNGWHPHLHVLFFVRDGFTDQQISELSIRWADAVEAELGEAFRPNPEHGVRITPSYNDEYIAKFGLELARIDTKSGRNGHRTPWDLLQDAVRGDEKAADLWREYSSAMLGRRAINWSRGMKRTFGIPDLPDPEASDDRLAPEGPVYAWDFAVWLWDDLNKRAPEWLGAFIGAIKADPTGDHTDLLPTDECGDPLGWRRVGMLATGPPARRGQVWEESEPWPEPGLAVDCS